MGAPLAGGSGASCCVARGVPGLLQVRAVSVLPVSVRRHLWDGKGVSEGGAGHGVMFHRRLLLSAFPRGSPQVPEDIRMVLGCGELVGVE